MPETSDRTLERLIVGELTDRGRLVFDDLMEAVSRLYDTAREPIPDLSLFQECLNYLLATDRIKRSNWDLDEYYSITKKALKGQHRMLRELRN